MRLVIAGQSNASGRGTNNQTANGGFLFGNDYNVKHLNDPTDDPTDQRDTVSSDTSPAAAGSVWPLVNNLISAGTCLWVPCAKGGTSITQWQPGVDHFDRTTLYGSMTYRAQVTNAQAVLWWQGETDAANGMNQATYNGYLDTLANTLYSDLGIKLIACKFQNCAIVADPNEAAINAAIAEAWADNDNVLQGPDLTDMASDDDYHLKTDAKLLEAASRWYTALAAAFGW